MSEDCAFCRIATDPTRVAVVAEEDGLLAFMDQMPIREGHLMIIPRAHYPYLDDMPAELAGRAVAMAQHLARAMKRLYQVERVAYFATGTDIAHAHLHVMPMYAKTDLTSARYMAKAPVFADLSITPKAELEPVAAQLRKTAEQMT